MNAANQAARTDPVPGREDLEGYRPARWNDVIPEELRYDPEARPDGARPTVFDWARNLYGVDPATGAALRPFDNVGVQYGLEALNAGTPVITCHHNSLPEMVRHEQEALLVPPRSPEAIANAVQRLHDSETWLAFSHNARQRFNLRFSPDAVRRQWVTLLEQ